MATTTLTSCAVKGNSAGGEGGGLADFFGTTTLANCTVSGNSTSPAAPAAPACTTAARSR